MPVVLHRVVIGPAPPGRLDKALARDTPAEAHLSRSRLARLIADGHVRRGGTALVSPKTGVSEGDLIEVEVPEEIESDLIAEPIPVEVVFEDHDLAVISKPAGMVVHPGAGTPRGTLVNALMHHFGDALSGVGGERRPGIVHRIDKDTSGLLVVAKTDRAHHELSAQFAAHSVERSYIAFCHGVPSPGDPRLMGTRGVGSEPGGVITITTGIGRHPSDRQRQAVTFSGGRHAVTRVALEESYAGAAARLMCRLETGRTHQIRVHLRHAGHALIGDPVYGTGRRASGTLLGVDVAARVDAFPRQALHAATLGFRHPGGQVMRFEAALPPDMAALQSALGTTNA